MAEIRRKLVIVGDGAVRNNPLPSVPTQSSNQSALTFTNFITSIVR